MNRAIPGLLVAAFVALVPGADADLSGPCTATVAGQDVALATASDPGAAIVVQPDDSVPYAFVASSAVTSYDATAHIGPYEVQLDKQDVSDGSTTTEGSFDIAKASGLGVGVYEVTAVAELADGNACEATFLIRIDGNPLASAAGMVSAVGALLAAGSVIAVSVSTATGIKTLLLTLKVL